MRALLFAGALALLATAVQAADARAGKARFSSDCGLCHSAEPGDGGGGMGPKLLGLVGRKAGTGDPDYPYSAALRASGITWDVASLDRFLSGPAAAVPGTIMPASVPDKAVRDDLIAYLQSLSTTPRP